MEYTIDRQTPNIMRGANGTEVSVPDEWRVQKYFAFFQGVDALEVDHDQGLIIELYSKGSRMVLNGIWPEAFFGETLTQDERNPDFYHASPSGAYAYGGMTGYPNGPNQIWWV